MPWSDRGSVVVIDKTLRSTWRPFRLRRGDRRRLRVNPPRRSGRAARGGRWRWAASASRAVGRVLAGAAASSPSISPTTSSASPASSAPPNGQTPATPIHVKRCATLTTAAVDYAFDLAGTIKAMETAYLVTRLGGTTVTAGLSRCRDFSFKRAAGERGEDHQGLLHGKAGVPVRDIPRFIALYQQGKLPVDRHGEQAHRLWRAERRLRPAAGCGHVADSGAHGWIQEKAEVGSPRDNTSFL